MYKCEVCGKEHSNITDRAKCELNCAKRIEEEARKVAEAKKKAEKDVRRAEVECAINNARKLLTAYIKDYNTYEFTTDKDDCWVWPNKLLSLFV